MVNQIANIELSAVSEQSARESLDLIRTAYSSGSATLVQVLDAQNNLVQAQLAQANATYNYLITSLILDGISAISSCFILRKRIRSFRIDFLIT